MNWTPGVVPYGADETVYLVVDSFGARGSVYRETEIERADLETAHPVASSRSKSANSPAALKSP